MSETSGSVVSLQEPPKDYEAML